MSDNTDFDVDNYSTEDLIHILKLQHKVPLTKAQIIESIETMIEEFEGQEKYIKFFLNVQSKLLNDKDIYSYAVVEEQATDDVNNISEMHELIKKVAPDTVMQIPGELNGLNNNNLTTTHKTISFDSQFRPMLSSLSVACPGDISQNTFNRLTHDPSDYTINLSRPNSNVIKIKLTDVNIPMNWYVFSEDYGTNYIDLSYNSTRYKLSIEEGNYNETTLINALNTSAIAHSIDINFSHTAHNNKVKIENNTGHILEINWYYPLNSGSCGYAHGQKMDYNLGWLLGFRGKSNTLNIGESIKGDSTLNTKGFDYIFISLDDFVNNKPNQDLITNVRERNLFKLPSYYNIHTMDNDCEPGTFPAGCLPEESTCGMVPQNPDDKNKLTKSQQYTVDQLKEAKKTDEVDRYGAPSTSELFAKLVIDFDSNKSIVLNGPAALGYVGERNYFGPVTLRKFRIKLLSKFGHIINLNNRDWSFTIQTTERY